MVIILFDTNERQNLYPLTEIRAVSALRCGIFSAKERWEMISGLPVFVQTEGYLMRLYDQIPQDEYLWIDASLWDEPSLRAQILSLQTGEALEDEHGFIAGRITCEAGEFDYRQPEKFFSKLTSVENARRLQFPWQIFQWNDEQLRKDFLLIFSRLTSQPISTTNQIVQPENIIAEEGAVVEHCIINGSTGPVYIGKNAVVMEGTMIRGPVAICEGAVVKMGARLYGATTIGPYCIAGGEIKNSVMQSFSNKAHDGYLGDSVIGSWCNLGAGTSNSNIKNTAGQVNVWHNRSGEYVSIGAKCGVIMGDYSRTAINTSINTGSVIGVCCSLFGEGFPPRHIRNFNWGFQTPTPYELEKALIDMNNWQKLKGKELTEEEVSVLRYIFELDLKKAKGTRRRAVSSRTN
ncbi:MAG TPA: putative sugar nucleotidyl transferase [Parafilimonas sp.]|nr:putative sugar nucleotidyl transferase [Parafilimonas sp.]